MPEIERKFLVRELPPGVHARRGREILQGYLTGGGDRSELRLRRIGRRHVLTLKGRGTLARHEIEVALSPRAFAALWLATRGARLRKTRIEVPLGRWTAEVDLYAGALRGLRVVEVEFPSLRHARQFEPPPWFGREITGNRRYRNFALATAPARRR